MAGKINGNYPADATTASSFQGARQLALLGILLQSLHVLFGITAVIGVLVAHTKIGDTKGTLYQSHLRWQIVTFWLALGGYAIGLYLWISQHFPYMMLVVLVWVIYRILFNVHCWRKHVAIERIL